MSDTVGSTQQGYSRMETVYIRTAILGIGFLVGWMSAIVLMRIGVIA